MSMTSLAILEVLLYGPTGQFPTKHRESCLTCFGEGLCHFSGVRDGNQAFSFLISFRHVDSIFARGFLFDYRFSFRYALR
jgi:hypothetical protein